MSCHVTSRHLTSRHVTSCHVMSCFVMLCYVMLCYVCLYVCMHACMYACMYIYIYIHIYIYIYICRIPRPSKIHISCYFMWSILTDAKGLATGIGWSSQSGTTLFRRKKCCEFNELLMKNGMRQNKWNLDKDRSN